MLFARAGLVPLLSEDLGEAHAVPGVRRLGGDELLEHHPRHREIRALERLFRGPQQVGLRFALEPLAEVQVSQPHQSVGIVGMDPQDLLEDGHRLRVKTRLRELLRDLAVEQERFLGAAIAREDVADAVLDGEIAGRGGGDLLQDLKSGLRLALLQQAFGFLELSFSIERHSVTVGGDGPAGQRMPRSRIRAFFPRNLRR